MSGGHSTNGQIRFGRRGIRRMFEASSAKGFTLIEVMIVLAVTGLLFATTAALLAGKQNQTAFDQAIRQIQSQIQQNSNEVAIGFYPNVGNIKCTAGGSGPSISNATGTAQGANTGCIFLGKAMQFRLAGSGSEQFAVHTIAGLQKDGAGNDVSSLSSAKPKAVGPSSAEPNLPDGDSLGTLEQGLTTYRMWYNNGGGDRQINEVAFVSSLAPASGSTVISGSQQVLVVPVDDNAVNSELGKSRVEGIDAINSSLATSPVDPSGGVFICFVSGGTNQSALITIGNNGRQLGVTLDIKNNKTCDGLGV